MKDGGNERRRVERGDTTSDLPARETEETDRRRLGASNDSGCAQAHKDRRKTGAKKE